MTGSPGVTWYATDVVGVPYLRHLLGPAPTDPPVGPPPALCGERRLDWRPVEEFAYPDLFGTCAKCVRAALRKEAERRAEGEQQP